MKRTPLIFASIATLFLLGSIGLASAQVWNNPTQSPTGGNTPTPINVSGSKQVKSGILQIGSGSNNSQQLEPAQTIAERSITTLLFNSQAWRLYAGGSNGGACPNPRAGCSGSDRQLLTLLENGQMFLGGILINGVLPSVPPKVKLRVQGAVAAMEYCDEKGENCVLSNQFGGGVWSENASANSVFPTTIGRNVGIGLNNPQTRLHVLGGLIGGHTVIDSLFVGGNGTMRGSLSFNNNSVDGSGLRFFSQSDGVEQPPYEIDSYRGNLRIFQPGVVRLLINQAGNVGIGTANPPSFKLEVAGNVGPDSDNIRSLGSGTRRWANLYASTICSGADSCREVEEIINNLGNDSKWELLPNSNNIYRLVGNVGIGTATPQSKLSFGNYYIGEDNPTSAQQTSHIRLYDDGAVAFGLGVSNNSLNIAANGGGGGIIRLFTNGVEKVRVAANGNVGIGTTNPSSFRLEVAGDVGPEADNTRSLGSATQRWANLYASNIYTCSGPGSCSLVNGSKWTDIGTTGNINRPAGRVGIGLPATEDPIGQLHILNPAQNSNTGVLIESRTGQASLNIKGNYSFGWSINQNSEGRLAFWRGPANNEQGEGVGNKLVIAPEGNIGIGTDKPADKLHIMNNGRARLRLESVNNQAEIYIKSGAYSPWSIYQQPNSGNLAFYHNGGNRVFFANETGNVGIGLPPLENKLRVVGKTSLEGSLGIFGTVSLSQTNGLHFGVGSAGRPEIGSGVHVGRINYDPASDNPVNPPGGTRQSLDIFGGSTNNSNRLIKLFDDVFINGNTYFNGQVCSGNGQICTTVENIVNRIDEGGSRWSLRPNGLDIYRREGNVGIGVVNPSHRLHVESTRGYPGGYVAAIKNFTDATNKSGLLIEAGSTSSDFALAIRDASQEVKPLLFVVRGDGKVGVGLAHPGAGAKLHVAGSIWADNICTQDGKNCFTPGSISGSKWLAQGSTDNIYRTDGNVGIGTNDPKGKLHVKGGVRLDGALALVDTSPIQFGLGINRASQAGLLTYVNKKDLPQSLDMFGGGTSIGKRLVRIFDNLYVGGTINALSYNICNAEGTCSPLSSGLEGSGNVGRLPKFTGTSRLGNSIISEGTTANNRGYIDIGGDMIVNGMVRITAGTPGPGKVLTSSDNSGVASWEENKSTSNWEKTATGGHIYRPTGNVGIGTQTPLVPLSLGNSSEMGDKLAIWQSNVTNMYGFGIASGRMYIKANGSESMTFKNGGNVGIGTTDPLSKLHVNGTGTTRMRLTATGSGEAEFYIKSNDKPAWAILQNGSNGDLRLAQYTSSDGEKTPLRLKSGGTQVVIQGNPRINPTLEVDGTIKIRGGSPTAGKVLTSKDNFGTAEWSTIPRSFIASTPRGSESISYYPADITPTPVVEMTKNDNPAGQIDFLRLHCPAGYIATGGGAKCDGAATRLYYSGHAKPGVPDAFRSNSGRTYSWHQTWIVSCGNQINDIEYMSVTCTPIN